MDERELTKRIDEFLSDNRDAIVRDIARLVAVPSTRGQATPGAPYGAGPRKALDEALDIAAGFGLATKDGDGYVGWAELTGREAGHIATITHVDVVPEGEGWSGEPFTLAEREGWLIGRGVTDDKGPSVLCLYLAKFFKELGTELRYGLRVMLGCDEESGMGDLAYYFEHNEQPLFAFSPDADFPVCNGEKGHYGGWFVSAPLAGAIKELDCGLASNVIPGKAECVVAASAGSLPAAERITLKDNGGGTTTVTALGIGGHAAHPADTCNAIGVLVDYLLETGILSSDETQFMQLLQLLHRDPYGSGLGIACRDDMFNALTLNGGVLKLEDGRIRQSIDIRYPTATSGEALEKALSAAASKHGATFEQPTDAKPFYIPADSIPIQTLLRAYNEVSGKEGKPFTMGGGTYARHFKSAVSFGPGEPDQVLPDFAGPEHAANEGAQLDALLTALKIYILAVWRLQQVEL